MLRRTERASAEGGGFLRPADDVLRDRLAMYTEVSATARSRCQKRRDHAEAFWRTPRPWSDPGSGDFHRHRTTLATIGRSTQLLHEAAWVNRWTTGTEPPTLGMVSPSSGAFSTAAPWTWPYVAENIRALPGVRAPRVGTAATRNFASSPCWKAAPTCCSAPNSVLMPAASRPWPGRWWSG